MPAVQLMAQINTDMPAAAGKTAAAKSRKTDGVSASFSDYMQQPSGSGYAQASVQGVKQAEPAQASEGGRREYEQRRSEAGARVEKAAGRKDGKEADVQTVESAVEDAAQEIKEAIAEEFGADPEQIEEAMQLLGLTALDLLDPQKLMALTMELTGTQDAAMMLFREDFQNILQQVSVITEDLLKNLGMDMEDLQAILQQPEIQTVETAPEPDLMPQEPETQTETAANVAEDLQLSQPVTAHAQETVRQEAALQPQQQETDTEAQPQTDAKPQEEVTAAQQAQPREEEQPQQQGFSGDQNAETFADGRQEQHAFSFQTEGQQNVQNPVVQEAQPNMPAPQVDVQDIIEQISRYVRVTVTEDVKSLEMQLNPESLGKIYLHISEHEGAVTAHLTAQNENVKEALVQQMAVLRENLEQQGVKVDAVEVSVGAHEFESNLEKDAHQEEEQARQQEEQAQRNVRRSLRLDDLDDFSGMMTEEEALVAQIMRDNGNSVDYKA